MLGCRGVRTRERPWCAGSPSLRSPDGTLHQGSRPRLPPGGVTAPPHNHTSRPLPPLQRHVDGSPAQRTWFVSRNGPPSPCFVPHRRTRPHSRARRSYPRTRSPEASPSTLRTRAGGAPADWTSPNRSPTIHATPIGESSVDRQGHKGPPTRLNLWCQHGDQGPAPGSASRRAKDTARSVQEQKLQGTEASPPTVVRARGPFCLTDFEAHSLHRRFTSPQTSTDPELDPPVRIIYQNGGCHALLSSGCRSCPDALSTRVALGVSRRCHSSPRPRR